MPKFLLTLPHLIAADGYHHRTMRRDFGRWHLCAALPILPFFDGDIDPIFFFIDGDLATLTFAKACHIITGSKVIDDDDDPIGFFKGLLCLYNGLRARESPAVNDLWHGQSLSSWIVRQSFLLPQGPRLSP